MPPNQLPEPEKAALSELRQAEIKHSPNKIIRIAKLADGKIIFLELGDFSSGFRHIVKEHADDFATFNISLEQILDVIMAAVSRGRFISYQKRKKTRLVYEITFNSRTLYIAVTIGSNGYIVGANPRAFA